MRFVLGVMFWLACLTVPVAALDGEDTPEFKAAVEAWLEGKDLDALGRLSSLANEGNVAAQILLANIASQASLHSHVTQDLPRKERIALLRMQKGLSGTSWLNEAAKTEPLAKAMLLAARINERAPAVPVLLKHGEERFAFIALRAMLAVGKAKEVVVVIEQAERDLGDLPPLIEHLRNIAVYDVAFTWQMSMAELAELTKRLDASDAYRFSKLVLEGIDIRRYLSQLTYRDEVIALSGRVESWTQLRGFCEKYCPDEVAKCTGDAALVSAFSGLPSRRSPLEGVISNERYWNSLRAQADLARSLAPVKDIGFLSGCFVDSMEPVQAKLSVGNK